ncbi:MAG: hypothetical protein ACLTA5_00680 [Anaerococcus obesiensis]|nr:hypothetical protein [Anaerococcus obesiensis]
MTEEDKEKIKEEKIKRKKRRRIRKKKSKKDKKEFGKPLGNGLKRIIVKL